MIKFVFIAEVDDKVRRIFKLINNENLQEDGVIAQGNSNKEPLLELIEDFYKQYQSLYAQYDHLTGELRKKVHGKHEKEVFSSSSSDSDSDHSLKNKGRQNGNAQLEIEFQKITDGFKQELETTNIEVADLKELAASREEKEALHLEYQTSLSKLQEAEKTLAELNIVAERSGDEKSKLLGESEELQNKLEAASKMEAELNQRLEDVSREKDSLLIDKDAGMRRTEEVEKSLDDIKVVADQLKNENITLGLELENARGELSNMQQLLESANLQVADLSNTVKANKVEMKSLTLKIAELLNEKEQSQNEMQELRTESSQLMERLGKRDREVLELEKISRDRESKIEGLTAQLKSLLVDVDSLHTQKREVEELMLSKSDEASAQVNALQQELELIQSQKVEMGLQLERKSQEISDHLAQTENFQEEILKNTQVQKAILEEKESLAAQINDLESKVDFLSIQKSKLEEHVNNKNNAINQLMDKSLEMERLSELEDEFFALQKKSETAENEVSAEITDLTIQVENLHEELNSLHVKNKQLELQLEREKQEYTQVEGWFQECKSNLESKDETVAELEETVEELKRELEVKVNELTDQLLTEKEESFRLGEAKVLHEQKLLEERIARLSRLIAANNKAHHEIITNISETVNITLLELETVIQNFKDQCGNYEKHILNMAEELKTAKNWVSETNSKKKQLEEEVGSLVEQLKITKEREIDLKGKAEKLEAKAREELARAVKEKEDGLVDIGEEKREAIRQLCIWIEYHRDRYDDLRMTSRVQRTN